VIANPIIFDCPLPFVIIYYYPWLSF